MQSIYRIFLVNISDITHTRSKDTRTLQISKARQENQASVSVYVGREVARV